MSEKEAVRNDIPKLPLEEYEVPAADFESAAGIMNEYNGSLDYGVIGSGQAGGRIAKSFWNIGYRKVLAINTAEADIRPLEIPEKHKMLIGETQGSGKNMDVGRKATEDAYQRVFDALKLLFGKVDKIIITVGFGGGTGAGGLPVLIDIAQKYLQMLGNADYERDVIVLGALPTAGELRGDRTRDNNDKVKQSVFTLAQAGKVGPIMLIDNSKIESMYKGIPPAKFWSTINDTITGLFQTFNLLSAQQSSHTSFDAADYRSLISVPGLAVMGVTRLPEKDLSVAQALQDNFKKTVLASAADFKSAKAAGCIFAANDKVLNEVPMDIFNYGYDAITNLVGSSTVYRGLYETKSSGIRAYTLIAGMKAL
jgi:cell division GTPase FtsZ